MILTDKAEQPIAQLILAHGAGAGRESDFMQHMATLLCERGIQVHRFNFAYMQTSIDSGKKRPPGAATKLLGEFEQVIHECEGQPLPLFIGGKSMGGRIASMLLQGSNAVGAVCMGYPFHPPGKSDKLRVEHLMELNKPLLVLQGERDTFGNRDEIPQYALPANIQCQYLTDGDHSFKPRKASGLTEEENRLRAAELTAAFVRNVLEEKS